MAISLVTGGCGFVGSHIARQLVEEGESVRVLALPGESDENVADLDLEIVYGDVRDRTRVEAAVRGADTVYHVAAVYRVGMDDPSPMYEVNLRGTFNVLEAARRAGVSTVVYTASMVALGRPPVGEHGDEHTPYETWPIPFHYAHSKHLSCQLARDFADWGLDVRIVCPGVVLGPGDRGPTPSGQLIVTMMRGGLSALPIHFEGGTNLVDVRDAAQVHLLAARRGKPGETYLATAHNLTNGQLTQAIGRALGRSSRSLGVPVALARPLVAVGERIAAWRGEPPPLSRELFEYSLRPSYFDNTKAVEQLGASFRPLDETLRDAVAYFRDRI